MLPERLSLTSTEWRTPGRIRWTDTPRDSPAGVRLSISSALRVASGRGEWNSRWDYIMVLLGYAIGIGNLWRFPYLVGKFGGGAFVVAYIVSLIFVACPVFFMELIWGQTSQLSTIDCLTWIHPRWSGVGHASAMLVVLVCSYYNLLLAYCCVYLVGSVQDPLPWTGETGEGNSTAAESYWFDTVLGRIPPDQLGSSGLGTLQWQLVASLAVVYIMIWAALWKGHESLSGAAWVMVIVPVVLLLVMLGRAMSLEGMGDGLRFYLGKFDRDQLASLELWATACGQILFSLSPGMGTAITMSSYTDRKTNLYKVNLIVTLCNSTFSLVGGVALFGILGHVSHKSCLPDSQVKCRTVDELASESGTGLAFVSIAEGLGTFSRGWAQALSVLFFLMLLALGLDSTFAWMETVNTSVNDFLRSRGIIPKKHVTAAATALLGFLLGLPFCTQMGNYLLDVVDHSAGTHVLLLVVFTELVALRWDYTIPRLCLDVKQACDKELSCFWTAAWGWIAPVVVLALMGYLLVTDIITPYEGYPIGLQVVFWVCYLLPASLLGYSLVSAACRGGSRSRYEDIASQSDRRETRDMDTIKNGRISYSHHTTCSGTSSSSSGFPSYTMEDATELADP